MIKAEDFDIKSWYIKVKNKQSYIVIWNQQYEIGYKELTNINNSLLQLQAAQTSSASKTQANQTDQTSDLMKKCEASFTKLQDILNDLHKIVIICGDVYAKEKSAIYDAQIEEDQTYSKLLKLEKFMATLESAYQSCESCLKKCSYNSTPPELQLILSRWQLGYVENELFEETFDTNDLQF